MGIIPTQTISSWLSSYFFSSPSSSASAHRSSSPTEVDFDYQDCYGLSPTAFATLITNEYPSLHSSELVHLDHAASPPPSISAVSSFASAVSSNVYSNPHSHTPTQRTIDKIRARVMRVLFNLREREQEGWDLVWTSGTTASLKIIGERFPWTSNAKYRYMKESHTSLVGIRACALSRSAVVESLDLDAFLSANPDTDDSEGYVLNAYPAQCNVTGSRLGLHPALIHSRQCKHIEGTKKRRAVLVDAAAYLSTSPIDLSCMDYDDAPDFLVGSFYKIYGHPTGLGFLLLKRSSAHLLAPNSRTQNYFGGGAIDALSVSSPYWVHPRGSKDKINRERTIHEQLEDGTIPYLSIIALDCAIDAHQQLFTPRPSLHSLHSPNDGPTASLHAVGKHAQGLANLMRREMKSLTHWDGTRLVRIHRGEGSGRWESDGATIAFTLYAPTSRGERPIGHNHLGNLATVANVQLRTGGMCNTGVLARVSELSDLDLQNLWEEGRVCGDGQEFGGDRGTKPLGLARISFGAPSGVGDVRTFVDFLRKYFLVSKDVVGMSTSENAKTNQIVPGGQQNVYLDTLVRYPIKSCAGQSVSSCKLAETGLFHDREFMLVSSTTGKTMSQKQFPRMALIKPFIDDDAQQEVMILRAEGMADITVPLNEPDMEDIDMQIHNEAVASYRPSIDADEWLSEFLGVPCHLFRFIPTSSALSACSVQLSPSVDSVPILFSNESPFTLISTSSVGVVNDWIASDGNEKDPSTEPHPPIHSSCFRANFTISSLAIDSLPAFHEDEFSHIRIGNQTFQVLAHCRRCLMICVNQDTGVRMKEPFGCLARHRRNGRRRVEFGVHLLWRKELSGVRDGEGSEGKISVGDRISWTVDL